MEQIEIGAFIAKKRKEKSMTQAELAEKLGVSDKTVSKWETGKSMPDYSLIRLLCDELEVSVSELMDGKETSGENYDEKQLLDLVKRIQSLENQKQMMSGIILIVMGIAMLAMSFSFGGSNIKDFVSGILLGFSVVIMLVGVYFSAKGVSKQ